MDFFGNVDLEMECFAGKILSILEPPTEICWLAQHLASLSKVEIPFKEDEIKRLQTLLVDKDQYIKESAINNIYKGKADEILFLLLDLMNTCKELFMQEMLHRDFLEAENIQNALSVLDNVENTSNIGEFLTAIPKDNPEVFEITDRLHEYSQFIDQCGNILAIYGFEPEYRESKDTIVPKDIEEMSQLCSILLSTIIKSDYPPQIVFLVGKVCDTINNLLAINPLDPYNFDLAKVLFKICSNPESFYELSNKGKIPREVGELFSSIYIAYASDCMMKFFMEDKNLSEDKRIGFKEALGIDSGNGQLVNICSQFVNKIYTKQA